MSMQIFLYVQKQKQGSMTMAVTHADLAPGPKKRGELGNKTGAFVIVSSILIGLCCFILCVVAEATRSEVSWTTTSGIGRENTYECVYNGSGKTPLTCAAIAFLGLAVAVVGAHVYLLVVVSKAPPPALLYYDPESRPSKVLTWQAGLFFVSTWVTFAVGEILLLVGLAIESGHLKDWSAPRPSCLVLRKGVFSTAGAFSLITVSLAAGLHITALRAQTLMQDEERARREVVAVRQSMPPAWRGGGESGEGTVVRESRNLRPLSEHLTGFSKVCDAV